MRSASRGPRAVASLLVSRSLARTSTCMSSRFAPVSARICVSPTAPSRSSLARASGRPALSSSTMPSIRSGSTPASSAARSMSSRKPPRGAPWRPRRPGSSRRPRGCARPRRASRTRPRARSRRRTGRPRSRAGCSSAGRPRAAAGSRGRGARRAARGGQRGGVRHARQVVRGYARETRSRARRRAGGGLPPRRARALLGGRRGRGGPRSCGPRGPGACGGRGCGRRWPRRPPGPPPWSAPPRART